MMNIKIDDTYNSSCGDQQFLGIVKIKQRKPRWATEENRNTNDRGKGKTLGNMLKEIKRR